VAKAAGGRALVPSRRALSLRLCAEWDAAMHTEEDANDVRVHVTPLGFAGVEAHEAMRRLLASYADRFTSVVSFRPTGWTYNKKAGNVQQLPKPWVETDGATRMYSVPYSEHSSWTELQALISCLRPRSVVPTVNADTRSQREALVSAFAHAMDTQADKGRRAIGGNGRANAKAKAQADMFRATSMAEQNRMWQMLSRARDERTVNSPASSGGASSSSCDTPKLGETDWSEGLAQLGEILGEAAPQSYVRALLRDAAGDVATALSVHLGANDGAVPPEYLENDGNRANCSCVQNGAGKLSGGEGEQLCMCGAGGVDRREGEGFGEGAATSRSVDRPFGMSRVGVGVGLGRDADDDEEDLALPLGTVAWVLGKSFKLYTSREALERRLHALGAAVVGKGTGFAKQEITLIVVAEGSEAGAVSTSSCPGARIVSESWVSRRSLALKSGRLAPPKPEVRAQPKARADAAARKRAAAAPPGGEKRACRERSVTGASRARLERALNERLYLIERRDASETSPSGLVNHRHLFEVLGSTGNVYTVAVSRLPSCTCFDFRERKQICKHLLFVYIKVLRLPRDSPLAVQHGLLRSELDQIFADGSTDPANHEPEIMASDARQRQQLCWRRRQQS